MDNIIKIIQQMDDLIEDSMSLFGQKVVVSKQEMKKLIKDAIESVPEDLKKAKYVSQERQKIIDEAEEEARLIIKEAEEKKRAMLLEEEIYNEAKTEAEILIKAAKQKCDEKIKEAETFDKAMRENACKYVADMITTTRNTIKEASDNLKLMDVEFEENLKQMKTSRE